VILINLLPHREEARKRKREAFFAALAAAAVAGGVVSGSVFLWYQSQISSQQEKNAFLGSEIKKLEAQIKDIANLQQEINALRARQKAVEDLQADRNQPIHLLSELVRQLPDGVYINTMRQDNLTVTMQGVAQSNERVSELLRNLAYNSPWLTRPELVEIVAGSVTVGPRDQRRISNFTIRASLVRESDAKKAGASAPLGAASGASMPLVPLVPSSSASRPASAASGPAMPAASAAASRPAAAVAASAASAAVKK